MRNQATPAQIAIAPSPLRFSQINNQNPIAATVRANTALQAKTIAIAKQNQAILPLRAANIAQSNAGRAITSG